MRLMFLEFKSDHITPQFSLGHTAAPNGSCLPFVISLLFFSPRAAAAGLGCLSTSHSPGQPTDGWVRQHLPELGFPLTTRFVHAATTSSGIIFSLYLANFHRPCYLYFTSTPREPPRCLPCCLAPPPTLWSAVCMPEIYRRGMKG